MIDQRRNFSGLSFVDGSGGCKDKDGTCLAGNCRYFTFSVMGVVKGQGILSLLGGIVIGAFCFTVSVLSRQAVGAGDGIVLGDNRSGTGIFR